MLEELSDGSNGELLASTLVGKDAISLPAFSTGRENQYARLIESVDLTQIHQFYTISLYINTSSSFWFLCFDFNLFFF